MRTNLTQSTSASLAKLAAQLTGQIEQEEVVLVELVAAFRAGNTEAVLESVRQFCELRGKHSSVTAELLSATGDE